MSHAISEFLNNQLVFWEHDRPAKAEKGWGKKAYTSIHLDLAWLTRHILQYTMTCVNLMGIPFFVVSLQDLPGMVVHHRHHK